MPILLGGDPTITRTFQGRQSRIASVRTWTFAGTWNTSETVTVEVNGRIATITAGASAGATATAVKTALAALTAQQNPEVYRYTWTESTAIVTATQKTAEAGRVDTITMTGSAAGTIDGVAAGSGSSGVITTAADSPNHWSARNWGGTAPIDDDVLVFENSNVDLKWNISQAAITPMAVIWDMSYTGQCGLPRINDKKSREAQTRYLTHGAVGDANHCRLLVGRGEGPGSRFIAFNAVTGQMTCDVQDTGRPLDDEEYAFYLLGTHASNVLNMSAGRACVAGNPGEVSTLATVNFNQNPNRPRGQLYLGPGCTLATIKNFGGSIITDALFTTGTLDDGGEWSHNEGAITTLNCWNGHWHMRSDGTITTLIVGPGGIYDCRGSGLSRTVTNCTVYPGAKIWDPQGTTTFTNGIANPVGTWNEVEIVYANAKTITFS